MSKRLYNYGGAWYSHPMTNNTRTQFESKHGLTITERGWLAAATFGTLIFVGLLALAGMVEL